MLKTFEGYHKGVDFGGWLSQCVHTEEHYRDFITEEDFATAASYGIDHLRIPVDYDLVEDAAGNYRESGFAYIQKAIDLCGKYHLNMILDLHKTYGFSFDDGEGELGFFENEEYQERFYRLWEQFAKRFSQYEERVAFELLNEVTDKAYSDCWNRISNTCIDRIRAIAPTIKILVGGYWNNSPAAVRDLAAPHDENIVYNFHCYDPLIFTHQGAGWVKDMPADFRISFKSTYGEFKKAIDDLKLLWGPEFSAEGKENETIGADYFKQVFMEAVAVADGRGVPLYCGEYGVIEQADPQDEVDWYRAINEAFEYYGIGRAAWSFKRMNFGLSDARLDGVRDELIKLL